MTFTKKGELSTQQIIVMIVLITSFVVLLFFIFRLNLGEESQKEICHNSVASKGISDLGKGLDCKTNYLCVSGGGECGGIVATQTVKVDLDNKREIYEALANEMSDCWWIFGEGEVDYVKSYKGYHCAICSVVEFDEKLDLDLSYKDLFEFFEINNKSDSQTYLNYLYGVSKSEDFVNRSEYFQKNYESPFNLDEKYSIITGINSEVAGPNKVIPVYFMKTKDLNQSLCEIFDITKA